METNFYLHGDAHADPVLSTHTAGTLHIFNLCATRDISEVAYMTTNTIPPATPLFIAPTPVVDKSRDFFFTNGCADAYVPAIPDDAGACSLSIGHLRASSDRDESFVDFYTITSTEVDGEYIKLHIPNHNYVPNDSIRIGADIVDVRLVNGSDIFIIKPPHEVDYLHKPTRLDFGTNDVDPEDDYKVPKIRFLGVTGLNQPDQHESIFGRVSIASIIRGPCLLLMEEETCESFRPGDWIYLHLHENEDGILEIVYSSQRYDEGSSFSLLLGIFITQRAHELGMLASLCLVTQPPPEFELI